jgi:hypothetical protein
MKAVVVYESFWGNTASIARAIAEGIGPEARALPASQASAEAISGVDLIVAGAPLLGFRLPTDSMRKSIGQDRKHAQTPPDLSQPSLRSWLAALPKGSWPRGGVRDPIPVVSRGRHRSDRQRVGERGIPPDGQGPALHREGEIRPAPRRRAGASEAVGGEAGAVEPGRLRSPVSARQANEGVVGQPWDST